MCKLVSTITLMHMYLENLLVSIMAVDRVMAVVFYNKYGSLRFVLFNWKIYIYEFNYFLFDCFNIWSLNTVLFVNFKHNT